MYDIGVAPQEYIGGAHDNLTIRNNIFHYFAQSIWPELYPNSTGSTQSGLYIYNNTAYGVSSWSANQRPNGGPATWGLVFGNDFTITLSNVNVENNVFSGINTFGLLIDNPIPPASLLTMAPIVFDYNNWKLLTGTPIMFGNQFGAFKNHPMTTWATTYGYETHGLIDIDPSFTNAAGGDFTPLPGSPLRNAGTNRFGSGVVWDFNHKPRPPSGPFTIGAI